MLTIPALLIPPTNILTQAWATTFYNVFVKRNSAFVATIFASAFVFDMTFETAIDNLWDRLNAGVSIEGMRRCDSIAMEDTCCSLDWRMERAQ